jgi:hypothetical protein
MLLPSFDINMEFFTLYRLLIVGGICLHVRQNAKLPKPKKSYSGNRCAFQLEGF